MSKKQTRRSVSVSGEVYDRLRLYSDASAQSGSGVVEKLLREFFELPASKQVLAVAALPTYQRKSQPTIDKQFTVTTKTLEAGANWEAPIKHSGKIHPPIFSQPPEPVMAKPTPVRPAPTTKDEAGKKVGVPLGDMASKIFTF